jgi:hypothetical protein
LKRGRRFVVNAFKGKRSLLWLGGFAVLMLGLVATFVVLPAVWPTPEADGPEVDVPKMQNVPAEETPKMRIDLDDKR